MQQNAVTESYIGCHTLRESDGHPVLLESGTPRTDSSRVGSLIGIKINTKKSRGEV